MTPDNRQNIEIDYDTVDDAGSGDRDFELHTDTEINEFLDVDPQTGERRLP